MTTENHRLLALLKQGTISQEEYEEIHTALRRQGHPLINRFHWLVNPFERMNDWLMLLLGVVIALLMSGIGLKVGIHFPGALDLQLFQAEPGRVPPGILLLFLQTFSAGLVTGVSALILSLLTGAKALRARDFIGSFLFARFPYLLTTIALAIILLLSPDALSKPEQFSLPLMMTALVGIVGLVWQIMTCFYALKFASGLVRGKLFAVYASSMVLSEILLVAARHFY